MLTDKDMLEIADQYLERINGSLDDVFLILPELTIKKPYGNIYYFDYKKYLETGNVRDSVFGSAPFLVEKDKHRIVQFGTAGSLESQLEAYEKGTFVPALDTFWYPYEDRFSHK